jgi:sulfonate transport system substrate-binding protein
MITRRHALGALLAAPTLATALPVRAAVPKEFRIGYQKSGLLIVARQQGGLEARLKALGVESVKWVEFQYGPPIMEALGLGALDFGAAGDTPPIFAQAAGAKVVYVAATPAQQSAILVAKDSSIQTVADLKGRKLAFAKGSSSHNFVVQALAKAGLSYSDITAVFLNPADAAAAFARGSVDAWAVWDPYFALAEKRHGARVVTTTKGVLDSNSFYLANSDYAARNPLVLKAALAEIGRTTLWGSERRDELARFIAEATGVELDIQKVATDRATIELVPLSDRIVESQQNIADAFHKLGIIPRQINVRDAVWTAPQS